MKFFNSFVFALVMATMAGCALVPVQEPMPMRASSEAMFGPGRMPIPGRPPTPDYVGALGPLAPLRDNIHYVTIKNDVRFMGRQPLIVTRYWVAGIEKPIPMHFIRIFDHVFPVRFLLIRETDDTGLPPCQFLDGSGECKVRIVAQVASWRYMPSGLIVPSDNVACIEDTVGMGETEVLDWSHKMETVIVCPEQGVAAK